MYDVTYTSMALKKFKVNLNKEQPDIEEVWTYVQDNMNPTAMAQYSIDLLEVDHQNDRIVGLSGPLYSNMLGYKGPHLLHLIFTDGIYKEIYTIKYTVDALDNRDHASVGVLFDRTKRFMHVILKV